jgi:hypothetical protein
MSLPPLECCFGTRPIEAEKFRPEGSHRGNDPELGQMGADRVDHRGLLANEQLARAMEHQAALLLGRLGLDEPHVGPGTRLTDGLSVSGMFFCRLT